MGQTSSNSGDLTQLMPALADYEPTGAGPNLQHKKTHRSATVKIIEFHNNRSLVENYFKSRLNLKPHPQVFELHDYAITSTKKTLPEEPATSSSSLCTMGVGKNNSEVHHVHVLVQASQMTLQDEITNRVGKRSFEEIQIWSVLSSAVLGAIHLLEMGMKEPVLSPKGIGLSKEGLIKVGQWEISAQPGAKGPQDEGEIVLTELNNGVMSHRKSLLKDILLNYYWAPEGIRALQDFISVGQKSSAIATFERIQSKFQIFSLGMTIVSMCLRDFYYQTETFSERYLDKLLQQAIQIRKVQGKELSDELQKILRLMVKWDTKERIDYWSLKKMLVAYFQSHSQDFQDSELSIDTCFHQLSEQSLEESGSLSFCSEEGSQGGFKADQFRIKSESETSIISHFRSSFQQKNSLQNKSCSFEGSGMADQGEGDDQCPQPDYQEEVKTSNAKFSAPTVHLNESALSSRRSYQCSQKQPISIPPSHRASVNKIVTQLTPSDSLAPDEEDYGCWEIDKFQEEIEEQSPDIFESIEMKSSRSLHNWDEFIDNKKGQPEPHEQEQMEQFMTFNQSPTFQAHERSPYIVHKLEDENYIKSYVGHQNNEENIFTDPKLMEYIRSPIQSIEQSFHSTAQLNLNNYSSFKRNDKIRQYEDKENFQTPNHIQQLCEDSRECTPITNKAYPDSRMVKQQVSRGFYEGQKKSGMRSGYGVFYYNEGGKYKGNWLNNKMHGRGVLEYADGRVAYQGEWKDDKLHGHGVLSNETPLLISGASNYKDLNSLDECWLFYKGTFDNDDKCGQGLLVLSNGEEFKGMFQNDMAEGYGEFKRVDGSIIKGIWSENKFVHSI